MAEPRSTPRLTKKQRLFIEEYLQCWNASEAARRAGYSQRSARKLGSETLTKPDIAAEIKQRIDEAAMSANEVLSRLAEQARASIADVITVDEKDWRLDIDKMLGKGHLIKRIRETQYGTDIELYDAQAALSLMGKHLGLFVDRTEITGAAGEPLIPINTVLIHTPVEDDGE